MRAFVYWNLHRGQWSIRDVGTRRVVGHADSILLKNCRLKVSEKGRQRVLRERRKNVHAGVEGEIVLIGNIGPLNEGREVTYNPYKYATFVSGTEPVFVADVVAMTADRKVWLNAGGS
jgi:hypothetical protein